MQTTVTLAADTIVPYESDKTRHTISMMPEPPQGETSTSPGERRRGPRFRCNGPVQLVSLPWEGALLWGSLRNVGFGGCYIEDVPALQNGTRTELLLQVNKLTLRAIGHVRTAMDRTGIGIEFVQMTASGRRVLAELIEELERFRRMPRAPAQVEPGEAIHKAVRKSFVFAPPPSVPIVREVVPRLSGEVAAALQRRLQSWDLPLSDPSLDLLA
jgi:hypothetical protein